MTFKHNSILSLILAWLRSNRPISVQLLYANLSDQNVLPVCDLFQHFRPDIAIVSRHSVEILELTVCHESNLISSNNYKKNKYQDICDFGSTLIAHKKITPYFIKI